MMSRFARELSGALGAYWKESAEREIRRMEEREMNGEIFFGADGVVRWTSNHRVMPKDCREVLAHSAYRDLFNEEASRDNPWIIFAAWLNALHIRMQRTDTP